MDLKYETDKYIFTLKVKHAPISVQCLFLMALRHGCPRWRRRYTC